MNFFNMRKNFDSMQNLLGRKLMIGLISLTLLLPSTTYAVDPEPTTEPDTSPTTTAPPGTVPVPPKQGTPNATLPSTIAGPTIRLIEEEPISSGATLRSYVWKSVRSEKQVSVDANVVVIDLQNPYVKLDVMTAGAGNQFHSKQTVLNMAKDQGAIAGVNGSFFNTTVNTPPLGPQIANSEWMASPLYLDGWQTFAITKDNKPVIDSYSFAGRVMNNLGVSYPLAGINKASTWSNGVQSHVDKIYLYTSAWGKLDRANDIYTTPTEVLVIDNIVTEIAVNSSIAQIVPKNGFILRAAGRGTTFINQNFHVGEPINLDYTMLPNDPANTADVKGFQMMISGHTMVVKDGKPAVFTLDVKGVEGTRSRTGVGYSKDERYVYLITVDHSDDSAGMYMKDFQQLMVMVGVWKGINLDGGGSTQLAARPLGEFVPRLMNETEFGGERAIVNGLGVFSTAPQGQMAGIKLKGAKALFLNEKFLYETTAYDEYYNPVQLNTLMISWSASNGIGAFEGNYFTPVAAGLTTITATGSGAVKDELEVEVIGREQVLNMSINAAVPALTVGESYKLPVQVTTKSGNKRTVPADFIQWEFIGFTGTMTGNSLRVDSIDKVSLARMIARYDGFSTMLSVPIGYSKVWADFDKLTFPVTLDVYPIEVKGAAGMTSKFPGTSASNKALLIDYDFTAGTGNKASYAQFNKGEGIVLVGEPMQIEMKVLGDESRNWIRAEMLDSTGVLHRVDVNTNVSWKGWRTVSADLTSLQMAYPVKLMHVYVASPDLGHDERELKGQIAMDDITFQYSGKLANAVNPKIVLVINHKSLTVNDKKVVLDQAPIIMNATTMIPIKFIVEALGGMVLWDEKERKVTLIRENQLIEMWIDKLDLISNGRRVTPLVAPTIKGDRSVVPLKVIAQEMGWKVTWVDATKTIILE